MDMNQYNFRHYDLSYFKRYIYGKQIPLEGLSLGMGHEKTSVMGYKSLFEVSGIHNSNSELHITHDPYIKVFLCLSLT